MNIIYSEALKMLPSTSYLELIYNQAILIYPLTKLVFKNVGYLSHNINNDNLKKVKSYFYNDS